MTANLSHRAGLVTFVDALIAPATEADFSMDFGDFNATSVEFKALTARGKELFGSMFGAGAISINLPKSKAEDFARFVEQKGLSWSAA